MSEACAEARAKAACGALDRILELSGAQSLLTRSAAGGRGTGAAGACCEEAEWRLRLLAVQEHLTSAFGAGHFDLEL